MQHVDGTARKSVVLLLLFFLCLAKSNKSQFGSTFLYFHIKTAIFKVVVRQIIDSVRLGASAAPSDLEHLQLFLSPLITCTPFHSATAGEGASGENARCVNALPLQLKGK